MALPTGHDPLKDPKIAALMASIGINSEKRKAKPKQHIAHPPINYEEYLKAENIKEWPQRLTSEGILDLSESPKIWTHDDIIEELTKNAPYGFECFDDLENYLNDFSNQLESFAFHLSSAEERPSRIPDKLFHAPRKEILDKAAEFDAVKLHHSRKKKKKDMKQTMKEAAQASRTRNINRGFYQFWKKLFLSEASVALLQDTFWWFFLETFEHHPAAQDKIFTRIADSYIALFFSAHPDIRDKFFKEYPRCLAQCVYLAFCEAFPESTDQFTEEFVSELFSLVSEWITGVKPPVGQWKKWPWRKLCARPGEQADDNVLNIDRGVTLGLRPQSKPAKELNFELDLGNNAGDTGASSSGTMPLVSVKLTDESGQIRPSKKSVSSSASRTVCSKSISIAPRDKKHLFPDDSAPAGPGPDYERVLFNLGGKSPLVTHHLYMKHLRDKQQIGRTMKRTEVLQQSSSDMTFQDVIKKSKRTVKSLRLQREKSEMAAHDDILKFHKERRKAIKEVEILEKTLTDPIEIKIRSDRVLELALEKGFHRSSQYGESRSTPKANLPSKPKEVEVEPAASETV
ncbi:protein FAM227B-like isoform X2 [Clavelina lepadiformis]|uniref:protein FAM227B-like isoform X2 n=1 Tax=Clavelina lepadiformis TaxID=159417 RepID=UPI004041DE08